MLCVVRPMLCYVRPMLCYVWALFIHSPEQPVVCIASCWQCKKGSDVVIDLLLLIREWTNTRTTNRWTWQNLVSCLTYFQRLVLPHTHTHTHTHIYSSDQKTWYLCCTQLWSARSGHCLVRICTARQSSKNIYFVGNRNTLFIVMELLLLMLYFVFY